MTSSSTSKKILISVLSFALGAWAFVTTQAIVKETFDPILKECTSKDYATMEDFVAQTGYQPYDKRVGFVVMDPFVCMMTQFIYELVQQHPAGLLTWGMTILNFPCFITLYLEAGRQGSKGLLLWSTVLMLLFQVFGISSIFPALWVPSYCLWGNDTGSVSLTRARLAFWISLAAPIFTVLVFFVFSPGSELWNVCAGTLVGPMLCTAGLLLILDKAPQTIAKQDAIKSAETSALSYGLAGLIALVGYFYLAYTALTYYGLDPTALLNDVWFEATPGVQFMTIDAIVLWMGMLLHIGSRDLRRMVEAIACTPFFGPGAACAMALASIEMDASPQWTPSDVDKKET